MACLRSIWWMTASLPLTPAADDFDRSTSPPVRFQGLTQVWAIDHSLSAGTPLCQLESPGARLVVPMFRLSTVGSRTFNVSGPRIWNGLPEDVRSAPTFSSFRRRLKPFLFQQSYPDSVI